MADSDFCGFCGFKEEGDKLLLLCSKCPYAFHFECCGEPEVKDTSHWECPDCSGKANEVFTWDKMVPYPEDRVRFPPNVAQM